MDGEEVSSIATQHQAHSGPGRSIEEDRGGFLRLVLKLDAAASGALGVLVLLAAGIVLGDQRPFVLLFGTPHSQADQPGGRVDGGSD